MDLNNPNEADDTSYLGSSRRLRQYLQIQVLPYSNVFSGCVESIFKYLLPRLDKKNLTWEECKSTATMDSIPLNVMQLLGQIQTNYFV